MWARKFPKRARAWPGSRSLRCADWLIPGATLAILGGILLILSNRQYYVHALWLHIKLVFVLLLIVLHVIVGTRSKAYAAGRISLDGGYVRLLAIVIVLVFISILVATLPGEVLLTH